MFRAFEMQLTLGHHLFFLTFCSFLFFILNSKLSAGCRLLFGRILVGLEVWVGKKFGKLTCKSVGGNISSFEVCHNRWILCGHFTITLWHKGSCCELTSSLYSISILFSLSLRNSSETKRFFLVIRKKINMILSSRYPCDFAQ